MAATSVAVIDIGSNTIKLLVARREPDGSIVPIHFRTVDARLGTGMAAAKPILSDAGMQRACEGIASLLAEAVLHGPSRTALVATSAVRDAANGAEFCARVAAATGQSIRILTGEEEAALIGRGLTCDPALRRLADFYVFDLGGGSLECLSFRQRRVEQACSLPLGCVRLTEMLVRDAAAAFTSADEGAVARHVQSVLGTSFRFDLPASATAIATGGTITTVRGMLGAREGKTFAETSPVVEVRQLKDVLAQVAALPLEARRKMPGLPAARADVFPAALATFVAVAAAGGFSAFRNSVYSLRFGVADKLLESD